LERRLAAILAADVVGYSRLMGDDEAGTLGRLTSLRKDLLQPRIAERKGRVVKFMGDGLLAEFSSVVEAVQCAVDIQQAMAGREAGLPDDRRIRLRIGVNLGDVIVEDDDIHGDGVNLAARLEALADPGGICLSGDAYRQVRGRTDAAFEDLGERVVKNIREPLRVWRWSADGGAPGAGESHASKALAPVGNPVIAVIAFDNLSRDETLDDFADGLTDEILTAFSRQTGMKLLARSSMLQFKGRGVDVVDLNRKLGAHYVLQGSVRKAGDRVRVTAQLVEAERGNHLWGDQFDGTLSDVFTLQDDVTFYIVSATRSQIHARDAERVRDVPEEQLTDNELLALASQRMQAVGEEDQREAARLLERVVQRSPRNAMALAMLASCTLLESEYDYREVSEEEASRAFDLIDRSVQLDEESDFAHLMRGRLLLELRGAHHLAVAEAERALQLNPNYPYAYALLGYATLCRGEPERGMALIEKALRADTRRAKFGFFEVLAIGKFLLGDCHGAMEFAETAAQRAGYLPYLRVLLAVFHAELGQIERARAQAAALLAVAPEATIETIRRPPFQNEADTKRFIEGLRKAGIPEQAKVRSETGHLPLPDKPSIAVLPFGNLSGDPGQDYFSDGITEDIITELSRFPSLMVIARTSSFTYKGQAVDVRRVAQELGVRYVLEGSIRRAGRRVRITAQLLDSATGEHVWAERYDRDMEDIFDLQDEITRNVAAAIAPQIELAEVERSRKLTGVKLTAYELALKAHALFYDGVAATDPQILDRAETEIDAVLRLDPRNVHALWTKSLIDFYRHVFRWGDDPDAALASCVETTNVLMKVDSSNAQVYMIRAWSHLYRGNFEAALADHRRAMALNPNLALNYFAMAWTEAVAGLTDEAKEHAQMALRLSPRDADIWRGEAYSALALVSFYEGDFEETIRWAHVCNLMQPVNQGLLVAANAYLGDTEAARSHAQSLEAFAPGFLQAMLSGEVEVCRLPEHNTLFVEGLLKAGFPERGDDPPDGQLPLPDKPSIAVLPFENISGGREQDRFADGITEEIITTLSKVSKLFVIARTSVLVYKDRAVDIRQVGREQGVQYVLEGSVRSGGERLRVAAQLIEAETGRHIWAQRYDRAFGEILALQDDLAKEIVSALQVELTAGEQARLAAQGTQNAEAWRLTFEGRDLVHQHHKDSVQKGKRLLEQAIGLDDTYALAWDALAEAHWKEARNEGWSASPERSFERAVEASDRALALAPENADVLAMRSVIMTTQRDFDGALALAEKALRFAHSNANAIAIAAITLYACGKPVEAIRQTELAMRHCPRYPPWYLLMLARCRWMLGQAEEAVAAANAAIAADPAFSLPYVELAMVHAEAGRETDARKAVNGLLRIDPDFSAGAYMRGLPLRDPEVEARRRAALKKAGVPD